MKKTAAAIAVAALAVPAAAQADKPQNPGAKGQTKSAEAKKKKAPKTQKVGFSAAGDGFTGALPGLTTDQQGKSTLSTLTIDPDQLSGHARKAFKFSKADLAGTKTVDIADAVSGVTVEYVGFPQGDTNLVATDKVKLIGKIERTVTKGKTAKGAKFTYGAIDIKKIVITREAAPQA